MIQNEAEFRCDLVELLGGWWKRMAIRWELSGNDESWRVMDGWNEVWTAGELVELLPLFGDHVDRMTFTGRQERFPAMKFESSD